MSDQPKTRPGDRTYGPADWTPAYYRGDGLQPFDVIDAFGLDFYEGSALKYLLRWRRKNGIEDLCKARTYVQVLIDREQLADSRRDIPGDKNGPEIANVQASGGESTDNAADTADVAAILREVLDTFRVVMVAPDTLPAGYAGPNAVAPEDYERWRAVLPHEMEA